MRKVLVVFLCTLGMAVRAADYYVSSSGSDSANGLSSSTPWQSISKVNSAFSSLNPGDRILFRRGDHFYGSLRITRSGSSASPITIGAYGSGTNPVISGFTTVSGWNNSGGGIYSKAITCQSSPNMVTVNDINTPIGRWPNTGYLFIDSHVSNTSLTDSDLPSSPEWTGGEVVIRKNEYIWDRNKITDHSGTTLNYSSGSYYNAIDGYGFFIQNSIKTLDQTGEWYYDGSTFYMYFGPANPDSYVVKVSTTDQLASLLNNNYITFENITFEGANLYGVQISNSDYITVRNCQIKFTGGNAIYGPWNGTSPHCIISNNIISNSNNNAIKLMGDHTTATVTNNIISRTGLIIGMGQSGDGTYNAIDVNGDGSLVQNNTVESSGYLGIHFSGNNTIVSNNFVNGFNIVKNDGGGIYTYVGTDAPFTGQKVMNNVIINGSGYGEGKINKSSSAFGIYMDDRVRGVAVSGNTVANCSSSGIYLHNAHEIEIIGNTLYNNGSGEAVFGSQILFIHDTYSPDDPIRNLNITSNIFFAKTPSQKILSFCTISNDISGFGSADYNFYAKPVDNTYVARTWSGGWNSTAMNRSLSNWQSFTGKDKNSRISPTGISDVNKIRFEYNPTNSNKTVSLDANYIDVKGGKYTGTITLLPFSSVVLLPDPNQSAATPAPPPSENAPSSPPEPVAVNAPPVPVVNYEKSSYSGFENVINASGSYDPDNDKLTYTWVVPKNVPVSASSGPVIRYLGPVAEGLQKIEFTLKVSDGKTTRSKIVPVEILPYQPELKAAEVSNVEASGFESPYFPHNIIDGNIGTMWSANGIDQWIILELKEPFTVQHVKLAFQPGQNREAFFDVLGSEDKVTWEPILTKSKSCAFSGNLQVFDFPPSKTGKLIRYVKLVGQGNAVDSWNYISEFRIFGYGHREPTSYEEQPVKVYPNPATNFINILIEDVSMIPDFIRIISLSGKIVLEDIVSPGVKEFRVPFDLVRGIYIIQIGAGNLTWFTQKLVVNP